MCVCVCVYVCMYCQSWILSPFFPTDKISYLSTEEMKPTYQLMSINRYYQLIV